MQTIGDKIARLVKETDVKLHFLNPVMSHLDTQTLNKTAQWTLTEQQSVLCNLCTSEVRLDNYQLRHPVFCVLL